MPVLGVQLVRRKPEMSLAVRISLTSEVRPDVTSFAYRDPDARDLEYEVCMAAGALAEHQCTVYGDKHNPDQLASAALKLLARLKQKGGAANRHLEARI